MVYKSVKNAYLSAAGEHSSEPIKRWVVDLDNNHIHFDDWTKYVNGIKRLIDSLHSECNRNSKQGVYKMLLEIPTKNGIHLITNPFNVDKFRQLTNAPIDIHRDNPTILFCP